MPLLKPKLFTTLQGGYTRQQFAADLIAGLVVGVVALPLAIAFAIASGVSPERGIYTAIIGGLLISIFGGSRVQIGGPTGAFVVIVAGIVQHHGLDGLLVATLMAGVILILMGVARFGSAIKFIPYPVVIGFTSGIALIIFSTQIKDLLGLPIAAPPSEFLPRWEIYLHSLGQANPYAVALSAGCLAILVLWKRVSERIPGPLVALLASTAIVTIWKLPVETIGSRFGAIPSMLPVPSLPHMNLALIRALVPSATTIALLAGIEALLSAVVADGMIGGRHRSNMELVAQGIANLCSPLFGGIPATGAIARTATNVHNGGRTPVAGIVHALTLFLILVCAGRWAVLIPLPCLAAILVIVAYHMSEWQAVKTVLRSPRGDVLVLLTTFGLTVLVDLTAAIQVGMVLAAFLFMHHMAEVTNVELVTQELVDAEDPEDPGAISTRRIPHGVEVYEINGPFFFGASSTFRQAMAEIAPPPKAMILRMRHVPGIDATGLQVLREQYIAAKRSGALFLLTEVRPQPLEALEQSGVLELIGDGQLFETIDDALDDVRSRLKLPPSAKA